jgi:hypothetical protein
VLALRGSELCVSLRIHELLEILDALLSDLDLGDPAAAMRIVLGDLVDSGGLLLEQEVDASDLAGNWCVNISGALDRLDGADSIARSDLLALLRELHENDVAELLGGILAETDDAGLEIRREINPLVLLGVFPQGICSQRCQRAKFKSGSPVIGRRSGGVAVLLLVAWKARTGQTRETGVLSAERAEGRAALRHRAIEAITRKGGATLGLCRCWKKLNTHSKSRLG